jgi:hypothetical protein
MCQAIQNVSVAIIFLTLNFKFMREVTSVLSSSLIVSDYNLCEHVFLLTKLCVLCGVFKLFLYSYICLWIFYNYW